MIPHSEWSVNEEVELTTSTQYVGSRFVIKVNGAIQVRNMVEFDVVMLRESTDRLPSIYS